MWGLFYKTAPTPPKNFNRFLLCRRRVCADSTWFCANRALKFCEYSMHCYFRVWTRKNLDLLLLYIAVNFWVNIMFALVSCYCFVHLFHYVSTNIMSINRAANHRFSSRLLKWRENRYVLQRNTICAESYHEVPQKSFCATFFKKWQIPIYVTFSKSGKTLSL